jgi:hypothetical protein
MTNPIVVEPRLDSPEHYDLFVATVGFEQRARFIAEHAGINATTLVASAFDARKTLHFARNEQWFRGAGFEVTEVSDRAFADHCQRILTSTAQHCSTDVLRLALDISSMSRLRMAGWIGALEDFGLRASRGSVQTIVVDFLYAPALFSEPSRSGAPITICEPVTPRFAGWSLEPDSPSVAIFGLGYEPDKAVGALEYIEPATVWVFRPRGSDPRYEEELEKANFTLWDLIPAGNVIDYPVDDPFQCFASVEAVVFGALNGTRPVLIPLGPKIFAISSLLVACMHRSKLAVWRVSSGQFEEPRDRIPDGRIVGLRASFHPQ